MKMVRGRVWVIRARHADNVPVMTTYCTLVPCVMMMPNEGTKISDTNNQNAVFRLATSHLHWSQSGTAAVAMTQVVHKSRKNDRLVVISVLL